MLIDIAKALIEKKSITPNDDGCQDYIANFLKELGFSINFFPFSDVKNLWATLEINKQSEGKLLVFAGHTDVVPPGPSHLWTNDPFLPTITNGKLYGRGAADMKSSIAAMLVAVHDFLKEHKQANGTIGFLITSDEEGTAIHGTKAVVEHLKKQGIRIDYCLIGEASSDTLFGDTIKIGRRGSLSGKLIIFGKQGHIAYPHLAENPIHRSINFLQEICETEWDKGNDFFQPTQFQISNIHAGTGVNNIIPAQIVIDFNFRYSPESTEESLKAMTYELLEKHQLSYDCHWQLSGRPFYSKPGKLTESTMASLTHNCNIQPKLSTSGGTSDGRFLIDISKEVIELGPINESIHKIDENIILEDLIKLKDVYQEVLVRLLK